MVFDRNIRQRNALFHFCSLADVRQVQIVLCRNAPGKSENGETKSDRFHSRGAYPARIFDGSLPDN